jgi:RNA polymerase sigma-70 factor (sigma-E family)
MLMTLRRDVEPAEAKQRLAADEIASFEEYVTTRGAALLRFAILLTGDDHRAEDLVQDVLARAYLRWRVVARTDLPDLYLRRMLVNASRSWWRRRSNRELPVAGPMEAPTAGDLGAESAERDAMWRLIARLSHRQRSVLVLRYYEDLDDDKIAQILDCSAATVRTHAMRGLHMLRRYHRASAGRRS